MIHWTIDRKITLLFQYIPLTLPCLKELRKQYYGVLFAARQATMCLLTKQSTMRKP